MNPLYFVATGVASAALGYFVGYSICKKKMSKRIEKIQEFDNQQLQALDRKLKDLKGTINAQLGEDTKKWKDIGDAIVNDTLKGQDSEEPAPLPEEKKGLESELTRRAPPQDRRNYHAIVSGSMYDDKIDMKDNGTNGVIRDLADNGIYEITIREFEEDREFPDEEMEYYEATGQLMKDGEIMDDDEIPRYIGYSRDELAARFLYDEPNYILVRNPDYGRVYKVYYSSGVPEVK